MAQIMSKQAKKKLHVLRLFDANIKLGADTSHNPHEFFNTGEGLYVSEEFKRFILSKIRFIGDLGPTSLLSYKTKKKIFDRKITKELGNNHIFGNSQICARIRQMILKQPGGITGDLDNNMINLFYARRCVVHVYWSALDGKWLIELYVRNVRRLPVGARTFSPASA